MFLRVIFGLAAGAVLGGFLGYFGKCSSGACPLTANPYRSAAFGALIGLLVTAGPSCNQSNYKGFIRGMEKVVTIESESAFSTSVLEGASIALVDFYADWCPHCRDLMPTIANLTERYEGSIGVYKVNVDKVRSLAVEYEIKSIPTVLIFKNGEEVKRFSGRRSKKEYINHLDDILKEGKP